MQLEQIMLANGKFLVEVLVNGKPVLVNGKPKLVKQTQFFNPMTIDWEFTYKNKQIPAGTSQHKVYVTLDEPSENLGKLYLTLLHLATSVPEAKDKPQAAKNTWRLFENKTFKTWDNRALNYYGTGNYHCSDEEAFLKLPEGGSAGCDIFANILIQAFWVNGIRAECTTVLPSILIPTDDPDQPQRELMLIKKWEEKTVSFPESRRYKWRFWFHDETNSMLPPFNKKEPNVYGDLKNVTGISGQNTEKPVEKVFRSHYIVRVSDHEAPNLPYYDPSYGVTHNSPINFEKNAVYGYMALDERDKDLGNDAYRVRLHEGLGNVLFEKNQGDNPLCGFGSPDP